MWSDIWLKDIAFYLQREKWSSLGIVRSRSHTKNIFYNEINCFASSFRQDGSEWRQSAFWHEFRDCRALARLLKWIHLNIPTFHVQQLSTRWWLIRHWHLIQNSPKLCSFGWRFGRTTPFRPKVEMLDDKLHDCESILIALSKKTNRTLRAFLERTVWLEEEGN